MVIFSDAFREAKFGEAERILASAMHLRDIVQNPLSNLSNLVSELKIKAASGEVSAVQIAQLEKEVESVKSKVN